jgi:uncharacterized damage-inducible protein DinB
MSRIQHICLLASYNAWMNNKLLTAVQQLPAEQLYADRQAFFGSIFGTLNHLLVADIIWLKRFSTHPANYTALTPLQAIATPERLDQQLYSELPGLSAYRQFLDTMINTWSASLTEADLDYVLSYTNMKGVAANKCLFSLIMHFFNHQTHHRGQISTLLTQAGVDLGVTDLLALIPNEPNAIT